MFTTGQKVVCVDDVFSEAIKKMFTALPVKDVTYTVRGTTVGVNYMPGQPREEGEVAVYLVELVNPAGNRSQREHGFNANRFVPLQELPPKEEEVWQDAPVEPGRELVEVER